MKKLSILILFLICLGVLAAHAQQSGEKDKEKVNNKHPVKKDTTVSDTTKHKKDNLGQQIEKEVVDLKNKIVNTGKELKNNSTNQLKKLPGLSTIQKDTTVTDTTKHKKKNGIVQDVKKDVVDVKDKVVNTGKQAGQNTKAQVNKIADINPAKIADDNLSKEKGEEKIKDLANQSIDKSAIKQAEEINKDFKNEGSEIKQQVLSTGTTIQQEIPDSADLKNISKEHYNKLLEEKALKLQYSSDDPENAPWKKNPFSKDDLGNFKLPDDPSGNLPGMDNKLSTYKNKVKDIKSPSVSGEAVSAVGESVKNKIKKNQLTHFLDSISSVADKLDADNLKQQLLGAKKVYSEKYLKKLYDSLGIDKADELLKTASGLLKTETPKDELLKRLNSSITGKDLKGVGYNAEKQTLNVKDSDKLNSIEDDFSSTDLSGLKSGDLSKLKLPQSVLSELPPLTGMQLDSKYLPLIDSMRDVVLKAKNYKLDEKQIREDVKRTVLKEKPSFLDKSYFEGIIGFLNDSTVNIIQASPALGYHFTDFLSAGLGPNLLVQIQGKKLNVQAGFRTFIKAEIWKQRLYLQVEDNVKEAKINKEIIKQKNIAHEVLGGAGALLPISKSLAINFAVLYRLNQDVNNPNRTPWVFRVGLSSVKKKHER